MSVTNLKLVNKLLDFTALRQKVISKNIANINTLNYIREDVKFESLIDERIAAKTKTTNPKHFSSVVDQNNATQEFKIYKDTDAVNKSGTNNVDVNREMAEMAQNTLLYKFGVKKLNMHFRTLERVIRGGR